MEVMPGDNVETLIWDTYKEIVAKHDDRGADVIGTIERFAFYVDTVNKLSLSARNVAIKKNLPTSLWEDSAFFIINGFTVVYP